MSPKTNRELEDRCINTMRILSADAVQNANSGHPAMPKGARHGSMLLYSIRSRGLSHGTLCIGPLIHEVRSISNLQRP